MFNSQMLDVAIGLIFVYFLLSLLCSVIIEMVSGLTKKRARMLRDGIRSLLNDPKDPDAKSIDRLYQQPLFVGNSTPKNSWISFADSFLFPSKKTRVPSYISSRSFVLSLMESLKQHPDVVQQLDNLRKNPDKLKELLKDKISPLGSKDQVKEFENRLNSLPDGSTIKKELLNVLRTAGPDLDKAFRDVEEWYSKAVQDSRILEEILKPVTNIGDLQGITSLVNLLPDGSTIKKALLPLLESAGGSWDNAIANMEKWYDEAMERVTGWYKRYSQTFAFILALCIALALNVDTFEMGRALYRDQALRASVAEMAQNYISQVRSDVKKAGQELKDKATGNSPSSGNQEPGTDKQRQGTIVSPTITKKSPEKKGPNPASPAQIGQSGQSQPPVQPPKGVPEVPKLEKEVEKEVEKVNEIFKQISKTNLPIGWPLEDYFSWDLITFRKFLGILLTALMVSLGSDFWFGLLSKLLNIRNAGKKPLTKQEQESQKK